MPANWATLPRRWECKYEHPLAVRCSRCRTRELIYGDREASRHGGECSMANSGLRRRWWAGTRLDAEFRDHRRQAVEQMQAGMQQNWRQALAICGAREWVGQRCWARVMDNPKAIGSLLSVAEAFTFEAQGPSWGKIARDGVLHTESGMLAAVARQWIFQAGLKQAVMFPRKTYSKLRRMVPLLLEPAQPWLVRYSWRAAREWERLRVKAAKAEAKRLAEANQQKSVEPPSP